MKSIGESDPTGATSSAHFRKVQIVGAPIAVVSLPKVLSVFENWVANKEDRFVLLRDVHGAMQARNNEPVRRAQNSADMVLPDGVPFVWAVRGLGVTSITRVCGIDLLPAACRFGVDKKWRHYFYGASPGVADQLSRAFREIDPDIEIVGTYCPPFRALSEEEDKAICEQIRAAKPDFVWVSLSTPKQDLWMHDHMGKLGGVTMVGVGGAFEINAGIVPRAPMWMQRSGMEWAFRLAQEPKRLWKRYFKSLPLFIVLTLYQIGSSWIGGTRVAEGKLK